MIATHTPPIVLDAIRSVNDPEYPDISIVDLGLVESIDVRSASDLSDQLDVTVGLIPTFSGCPALDMIATDVRTAVESASSVRTCRIEWLHDPVWSTERITDDARDRLRSDYTVVLRRKDGGLRCPVCGGAAVTDQSMAGPTRCRSVAWCETCRNVVEVFR